MHAARRLVLLGAAIAAFGTLLGAAVPSGSSVQVTALAGALRGSVNDGIASFRGIPYARPPVGDLRWQPPQKLPAWSGVRDATAFGSSCPQPDAGVFFTPGTTEDCLYLNVYAPARGLGKRRHAVMVWIPGGGLYGGSGSDYDPGALVSTGDTVLVTFNYRVGVLGFFAHPALDSEHHDLGDYGLMDQQLALHWVQLNIAAFGGDPHRVTIFGQSAGAISVISHLASPGSAHLFHRAIVESGGTPALTRILTPLDKAEVTGQRFAVAAGCATQTMACLRALSPAQILAAQPGNLIGLIGGTATLPQPFHAKFASGTWNRVPVMIGNTHDEWRWPIAQAEITSHVALTAGAYPAAVAGFFGVPSAPAIVAQYPAASYPSPSEALGAAETDGYFACTQLQLERWLAQYVPVYSYEFDDQTAPMYMKPVSFPYGAAHTIELQFLFPNYHGGRGTVHPLNVAQQLLSRDMVQYWTNFARRGDPNDQALVTWPRYSADGDPVLSLNLPAPAVYNSFATQHQCAFWDTVSSY